MKLESVYGIHAVTTLLQRSPDQVVEIWVQKGRVDAKMQKIL
ncbi:MAG: RNA methyltransferase substrate-binding domain-containing protein, partial [Pseudomonadota bacterium]|nr:RNA methyltransferase substrate-binding domain-containing protein [Pseudomonadota bacterium]